MGGRVHFTAERAHEEMRSILGRIGYDAAERTVLADHLLDAALCGYEYSGLPKILDLAGHPMAARPRTPPKIVHETPVSALVDGGNTVGMLAVDAATDLVVERASEHGFGVVGVHNSWMTGRSAYYVERIAAEGLIGVHTAATFPIVAPPGAAERAIGTNPIAFAFPTAAAPLVIDLGTSAFMWSELALRRRQGEALPEGVALDAAGHPTTDPDEAAQGALVHFAGYRGFAIGLAVQALGVFAGSGLPHSGGYGYLLVAMRPDLLVPLADYRRALSETLRRIKEAALQPGVSEIRIPSERSFAERRRREREGIEIDESIWHLLDALGRVPADEDLEAEAGDS